MTLNTLKKYLNDVVLFDGVATPYEVPELFTTVAFADKAAYFVFDLDDENIKKKEKLRKRSAYYNRPHSIDLDSD